MPHNDDAYDAKKHEYQLCVPTATKPHIDIFPSGINEACTHTPVPAGRAS